MAKWARLFRCDLVAPAFDAGGDVGAEGFEVERALVAVGVVHALTADAHRGPELVGAGGSVAMLLNAEAR